MFCACAVIVLILVSFVLGARVYVLLYFCLLSSHVFVFAAFEQVVSPPSSKLSAHLRVLINPFIVN
jgi:hypothetical protein